MNIKETSFVEEDFKSIKRSKKIDQFLKDQNLKIVIDSLGSYNSRLTPADFDLLLANIKELEKQKHVDISKLSIKELIESDKNNPLKNEIGYFAFSKLYLNSTKDEGLLYYFFNCGPKCGESAVILIGLNNSRWKIINRYTLSEL
jgi:hypothetical protein